MFRHLPRSLRFLLGCALVLGAVSLAALQGTAHASRIGARSAHNEGTPPMSNPENGPVMHKMIAYDIYWLPDGYSFQPQGATASDQAYATHVDNFMQDVGGSDWLNILTQYGDRKGAIQNNVTLKDSVVATNPFPDNKGTTDNPLLDSDFRAEIKAVIKTTHWAVVKNVTAFFLYTPDGVQSCEKPAGTDNNNCTFSATGGYCGYHSEFKLKKKLVIYGNEPDVYSNGNCDTNDATTVDNSPNQDPAGDVAINTLAHEVAEAMTDPNAHSWGTNDGSEVADLCDTSFLPRDQNGGDVTMGQDEYYIQALWSNQDNGCVYSLGGQTVAGQTHRLPDRVPR